jgi:3-hydroxybutyrate dehydrogenase
MNDEVQRPVVLVTGASRGIGEAVAFHLSLRAAAVLVAGRDEQRCAQVAARIEEAGGRAVPLVADLAQAGGAAHLAALARAACAKLGAPGPALELGWLVNNAGMAISAPALARAQATSGLTPPDLARVHMELNFHAPRALIEALAPRMQQLGRGSIVNIASSAGLQGYAYASAYCASKHALVGYTRALAAEWGMRGPNVHAVCPHYVDSPMLEESVQRVSERTGRAAEQAREYFRTQNPSGKLVTVEEVAQAVLELLECEDSGRVLELGAAPAATIAPRRTHAR